MFAPRSRREVQNEPRPLSIWQPPDAYGNRGVIELPFPPASLSGHNTGHWRKKSPIVAKHRQWARKATEAVKAPHHVMPGDIKLIVTFYPPDRRGDRINFPNRMKPYFDGIADALGVNDSRFVPSYQFAEPCKNPCVTVVIA